MPHTYYQNKQTSKKINPPRFKPSVALTHATNDQSEFKPFSPATIAYKTYQSHVPKITKPIFSDTHTNRHPTNINNPDNLSYFHIGGGEALLTTPGYTSSSTKLIQYFYPKPPRTNQNNEPPLTPHSSHVQYINHGNENSGYPLNQAQSHVTPHNYRQTESASDQPEEHADYQNHSYEEEHSEEEEDIRPAFPSPPQNFYNPVNKYENIENPFADPNFDFDKFIERLRNGHNHHIHNKPVETESKLKLTFNENPIQREKIPYRLESTPQNNFGPENVDLRKPVAFSSPGIKQDKQKNNPNDDYYYDDEEITEKPKKHSKPIPETEHTIKLPNKNSKPLVNYNTRPVTFAPPYTAHNTSQPEKIKNHKEEEYEYYDDYDYPTKQSEQEEKPKIKIQTTKQTESPKQKQKVTPAFYETFYYANNSDIKPKERIQPTTTKPHTIRRPNKPHQLTDSFTTKASVIKVRDNIDTNRTRDKDRRYGDTRPYTDPDTSEIRISRQNTTDNSKR